MDSATTILDGEVPRKPGFSQDPFIGGRIRQEFGEAQTLTLLADVGGFAVGRDLSWQAIATYAFDVTWHCQTNLTGHAKGADLKRSGCKLTPLGQGGRTVLFEDIAAVEVAVEVEVVVD